MEFSNRVKFEVLVKHEGSNCKFWYYWNI